MRVAVTKDGVLLDRLVFDVLGRTDSQPVEATLNANPGLAGELMRAGQVLAPGATVTLPEASAARPADIRTVKLWD